MGALYLQHLRGWQNNAPAPGMPLRAGAPALHLRLVFQPPMIDEGGTEKGEKKKRLTLIPSLVFVEIIRYSYPCVRNSKGYMRQRLFSCQITEVSSLEAFESFLSFGIVDLSSNEGFHFQHPQLFRY